MPIARALFALPLFAVQLGAQLPTETPSKFTPSTSTFDYQRRDVMIPMRDGAKLHTVILVPKNARRAPILLTRTPYDATATTSYAQSAHLAPKLNGYDNALDVIIPGGYIRVVQDVRGKYGSEGDYVMNRPLVGPLNPTKVDEATDTYDTIDWLVKNVPETNGNVGELGISYDGFEPLMGLVNPHPALKVSVPMNPMVDGWMGDDWFHNGAFRQQNMPYILEQEAMRDNSAKWWTDHYDDYDVYMKSVSAGELGKLHGLEQVGFWNKILEHPSYDSWWQLQAMDKILAAQPLKVPTMLVHSLWDQEDIYGAIAVYKAIKPKDTNNNMVFLTMGPWHHGQEIENGSSLGALDFDANTSKEFQKNILAPFLAHYLKDDHPPMDVAPVNAYETGTNRVGTTERVAERVRGGLHDHADAALPRRQLRQPAFPRPRPPHPIHTSLIPPSRCRSASRPIKPTGYDTCATWPCWLVDDQREASGRTDVLSYETGGAHRAREDQRPADGASRVVDDRQRRRLGRQAHRRLPRRGRRRREDGRISVGDRDGHLSREIPRGLRPPEADRVERAARVRIRAADVQSRLPAGAPDHGANSVELVPALRSQPADLCPEHLLGESKRLQEGGTPNLPRARTRKLHRVADRVRTAMSNVSATFAGQLP